MKKKKFETKTFTDEQGFTCQGIFVDGQHFDWGVDEENFKDAMSLGPHYQEVIIRDIEKHFLESLSEIVGRHLTSQDVEEAKKTGWI